MTLFFGCETLRPFSDTFTPTSMRKRSHPRPCAKYLDERDVSVAHLARAVVGDLDVEGQFLAEHEALAPDADVDDDLARGAAQPAHREVPAPRDRPLQQRDVGLEIISVTRVQRGVQCTTK